VGRVFLEVLKILMERCCNFVKLHPGLLHLLVHVQLGYHGLRLAENMTKQYSVEGFGLQDQDQMLTDLFSKV